VTRPARPLVAVVASAEVADRFARALEAKGVRARALAWSRAEAAPGARSALAAALRARPPDLLVATSRHAVAFLARDAGRGVPLAAVGPETARAARDRGFRVVLAGRGGGEGLARRLRGRTPGRALWLRGDEARPETAAALRAAGWRVAAVRTYRRAPVAGFADAAALAAADVWVVGSPAGLRALSRAIGRRALAEATVVAPGTTTARAARAAGARRVLVASRPTPAGVAAAAARGIRAARRGIRRSRGRAGANPRETPCPSPR
jgi:uroporphyrinogen-III synthase